jgi:hypothetical protein
MENQRISADELAQKLVSSRKIMRKVDTGDYEKGNINEDMLRSAPEEITETNAPPPIKKSIGLPVGVPSVEKIRGSKLPDAIKKAMIESPIPQITLNDNLDMDFVNKARKLMEQDGTIPVKKIPTPQNKNQNQPNQQLNEESRQIQTQQLLNNLESIIENCIRKILDEKLTQILNAQEAVAINENLVIKVGDSMFSGKITKVKSSK